ncbi:heterogeneous nuclear ribonucleoprotein Q-like [Zingiber officinale]|uniref:heterogeneous nuclear ribonucleoprotein Q-like n=1 Tax=Zingiber officinale TaxID=94328 RepID=UPI001C4B59B2|nr:heterogeneous nuclear ribonucleoprotein Q-like [Zingiber officinale]XP_042387256.1 heterogeneous nuclear ribonucleoprotein Q-like [Zingiber officinale]
MPRARAASVHSTEPENPVEPEEQVDFDPEMEEEVEYEEVEEEVEEEEEEIVEEEVEEEQETTTTNGNIDDKMDEAERKKHEELLSLPPHGSEIYVGGLTLNASEDELRRFCESAGEVTEVRVMKEKNSSENKGYGFVTFKTAELALKAIEVLNNTGFKGKKVKCSTSQAKNRLFIGNIPRTWSLDDLKKVVTSIGPGVNKVELIKSTDPQNPSHNRGYAFIEYYNHACAEYSRSKMSAPKFKLDEKSPTVSWADPRSGDSSSSQVKAIYVKNLPKDVTKDQVTELFECHGEITKVVLLPAKPGHEKRFGFVHFKDRFMAMKALEHAEKYELDGDVLDCSLAKPPAESKKPEPALSAQEAALLPNYSPGFGYGVLGGPYGAFAPGLAQPMIYGRGHTPAGAAMVPMILPDGRLGYVLQQPGFPVATHQQYGRNYGSSSSGGNNDSSRGRRFHPY